MEAASVPPAEAPRAKASAVVLEFLSKYGLIALLLALPVYYGIQDLSDDGNLTRLGNNLVDGLSNGAIWALVALGYTLVYGIIELINFAHGDVFMVGAFASMFVLTNILGQSTNDSATSLPQAVFLIVAVFAIVMPVMGLLGVAIERFAYRPLRNAPKLAPLITAVGFSFILQNVGLLWRGGSPQSVPDLINVQQTVFTIAGVPIQRGYILAFAVMIPLVFALGWFINSTHAGRAMRATAQDPEAARLMGINVNATISLTFLLGGMLAGAAGLVYALYQTNVWFFQGFKAGLIAFTAAVMGGIGNVRGAVLGGLIIGVIQALADSRLGPQWTEAVVFGYLIAIMVLRPRGLLGEETREAG